MQTLEQIQQAMMRALDHGPDHLPQGLFTGSPARIIAGMKVHANTISHARMVALEESFPRVLSLLGHAAFNQHSRDYLSQPETGEVPLADIGRAFPEFIARIDAASFAASVARFDWQWLQAFRAPDAKAFTIADLAAIAPQDLPFLMLQAHPATRLVAADCHLRKAIGDALAGTEKTPWLLLVRPADQVRIVPATPDIRAIVLAADRPSSIGNLLASCDEQQDDRDFAPGTAMQALIALTEAGALKEVTR